MAKRKASDGQGSGKKTGKARTRTPKSTRTTRRPKLCTVQIPDSAGRLVPEDGHYAAQKELRERLGGYAAMLAPPKPTSRIKTQSNLMGLAIGARERGGRLTGELSIKVFVRKKVPVSRIARDALVPPEINGYPTDVEEIQDARALSSGSIAPLPIPCGEPIANVNGVEEGTLGCLVGTDGKNCIMSCNHVIANLNVANVGDSIVFHDPQTGALIPIATLWKWADLVLDDPTAANVLDVAVAELLPGAVSPQLLGLPLAFPPRDAAVFDNVRKSGAATGVSLGLIDAVNLELPVILRGRVGGATVERTAIFGEQIRIRGVGQPFCDDGDSGSVILLVGTNQPVGLLFAGLPNGDCFANPIGLIVNTMQLTAMPPLTPA